MTFPALVMGFLISTLYGSVFHLWRGGSGGRLRLYIVLGWVGFWIGHSIANAVQWTFASVGPLRLGMATLGSIATLGIGYWLSLVEIEN